MKMLLAALILLSANLSSADVLRERCSGDDWSRLFTALEELKTNSRIKASESTIELSGNVSRMSGEEMGPVCESVLDFNLLGIPEESVHTYEITSTPERSYRVDLTYNVISKSLVRVDIQKIKQ